MSIQPGLGCLPVSYAIKNRPRGPVHIFWAAGIKTADRGSLLLPPGGGYK